MSAFAIFTLILLVGVTVFSLSNHDVVALRFLVWQVQTSVALAIVGAAVVGGLLVFVSSVMGQQHLRARLREVQARVRELEARLTPGERPTDHQ